MSVHQMLSTPMVRMTKLHGQSTGFILEEKKRIPNVAILGLTLDSPILHVGENAKILSYMQDIFSILKTGYTQSNLLCATSYLSNILSYINSLSMNKGLNKAEDMNAEKVINLYVGKYKW